MSFATASGSAPGWSCTRIAFTVAFWLCEPITASSRPGTVGRLKAGFAPVRWRCWRMASLSLRNCASWASLRGMKIIGSPPEETVRRDNPTTVYGWRRTRIESPIRKPLARSATAS